MQTLMCFLFLCLLQLMNTAWLPYKGLILVTCALYWTVLGAFSIDVDNAGDRLGYCITLLLADVVNIEWSFNTLPNIPYLTIIEKYIYVSFIFLCLVTSYSVVACGNSISNDIDEEFGYFFLVLNCLIHACFYLYCECARHKEIKHLMKETIEYREDALSHAVDLLIEFDENLIDSCVDAGKERFDGLALKSQSKTDIEENLCKKAKLLIQMEKSLKNWFSW